MSSSRRRRIIRWCALIAAGTLAIVVAFWLVYFPGRQSLLAITLSTGLGVNGLQVRVDSLEERAIKGERFGEEDKAFLRDLYTCFVKGARLTVVLRQSAQLMEHYLSQTGDVCRIEARIFLGSRRVQEQIAVLKQEIASDLRAGGGNGKEYRTPTFYMGDPEFFESYVGLYFGRLTARIGAVDDRGAVLQWRAEMPWQWPSYQSLYAKYGDYHAQSFGLPNLRSVLQGRQYRLRIDDGLGEHLAGIGLAKPFLVISDWEESMAIGGATPLARFTDRDKLGGVEAMGRRGRLAGNLLHRPRQARWGRGTVERAGASSWEPSSPTETSSVGSGNDGAGGGV